MKCNTRDFGEIEFDEQEIITFIQPPFGFEQYKEFILIHDDETDSPFAWMQSVDDSQLCFILIQSACFDTFFHPKIPQNVYEDLGSKELCTWGICIIPEELDKATVNLKSPVFICPETHKGMQAILPEDYPIRHPLTQEEE